MIKFSIKPIKETARKRSKVFVENVLPKVNLLFNKYEINVIKIKDKADAYKGSYFINSTKTNTDKK